MNCSDIRPMLSAFYDGEATPEEYDLVERHVASCPDCRRVMAEYRAIGGGIRALPVPVPPAGLRRDVWRAIEVQRPARGASAAHPARPVTSTAREERKPTPLGPLANIGRGWGKVGPATALLAAMLLIFAVAVLIVRPGPGGAAHLVEESPIKDYTQVLHVQFDKYVVPDDAEKYTSLRRIDGGVPVTITEVTKTYYPSTRQLTLTSQMPWKAGAKYEIYVDAQRISLGVATGQYLGTEPIVLPFDTLAYTPTPTNTATPTPTATRTPTARIEPTRVANNTPAVPPTAVRNSPTPAARPSNTRVPVTATLTSTPTRTPTAGPRTATRTVQPSTSPTAKSTQTPTVTVTVTLTATPVRKSTQTPAPRITATPRVSVTPTPPCSIMPVSGFGKLWREHEDVRSRLGCPTAYEIPIQRAAEEHFQGGYMFWRGDTNTIYVFVGTNFGGSVYQYQDTWQEDDPTPVPGPTPPPGLYAPVRGFGKIWLANPGLRQALGWATDQETGRTGAWQPFTGGSGLWTSDRVIRVLYDDGTWESYPDNYVTPTPAAHPPATNKP